MCRIVAKRKRPGICPSCVEVCWQYANAKTESTARSPSCYREIVLRCNWRAFCSWVSFAKPLNWGVDAHEPSIIWEARRRDNWWDILPGVFQCTYARFHALWTLLCMHGALDWGAQKPIRCLDEVALFSVTVQMNPSKPFEVCEIRLIANSCAVFCFVGFEERMSIWISSRLNSCQINHQLKSDLFICSCFLSSGSGRRPRRLCEMSGSMLFLFCQDWLYVKACIVGIHCLWVYGCESIYELSQTTMPTMCQSNPMG